MKEQELLKEEAAIPLVTREQIPFIPFNQQTVAQSPERAIRLFDMSSDEEGS